MTKRRKLTPPTNLDPEYLYEKFAPLRYATFKKHSGKVDTAADRDELMGTIDQLFLQLVYEYDAQIGVDFPYFIKKMLELRVYHHITKYWKVANSEFFVDLPITVEESYEDVFDKVVELNSLNPDIVLGDKHRQLLINTIIHKKTLQQQAEEEGVPLDRLHARMYFLIKKFEGEYEKEAEIYGDDIY